MRRREYDEEENKEKKKIQRKEDREKTTTKPRMDDAEYSAHHIACYRVTGPSLVFGGAVHSWVCTPPVKRERSQSAEP